MTGTELLAKLIECPGMLIEEAVNEIQREKGRRREAERPDEGSEGRDARTSRPLEM